MFPTIVPFSTLRIGPNFFYVEKIIIQKRKKGMMHRTQKAAIF